MSKPQNNSFSIVLIVILVLFLVGALLLFFNLTQKPGILFPAENTTLIKGKTYTLAWTGTKPSSIAIFLVNKAFEKEGVSVSLADRVYNVPNTGSYRYTVPTNIPEGAYKFEIGTLTSPYFQIKTR